MGWSALLHLQAIITEAPLSYMRVELLVVESLGIDEFKSMDLAAG